MPYINRMLCWNKNDDLYLIGTFEVNGKIIVKDITGKKDDNIQLGIKLAESILEV